MKSLGKYWVAACLGLGATAVAITLESFGFLSGLEAITWDQRARRLAEPSKQKIVMVLIDASSLAYVKEAHEQGWPWPREFYAPMVAYLQHAGAKSIGFDVMFVERSRLGDDDDQALADQIVEAPYVGALLLGDDVSKGRTQWPQDPSPPDAPALDAPWVRSSRSASFPNEILRRHTRRFGHVTAVVDADQTVRRAAPFLSFDGRWVPALGVACALPQNILPGADHVQVDGHRLPVDRKGHVYLRYRQPKDSGFAFETVGAGAVLEAGVALADGQKPKLDASAFKDAHVLFGASAAGLYDRWPTPIDERTPGVEVHATLLDNLLSDDAIGPALLWKTWAFAAGLAVLMALWVTKVKSTLGLLLGFAMAVGAVIGLGVQGYAQGVWWPMVMPAVALGLSGGASLSYAYATEGRQRRFIKNAFGRYLSKEVIDQIIKDPSSLKLGGVRRELSIFFSDLAGFSTISEGLDAEALTALLNDYLGDMSAVILDADGTLDKYEGDAIIAFWNAPVEQADHAARAVRAALDCQRRLNDQRPALSARAKAPMHMRIGVNTGPVVVGNMGSADRFDYTVLGDAANLASRLEGANKAFGTEIMVAESTWEQAKASDPSLVARPIGRITVVGRAEPVLVYEPMQGAAAAELVATWEHIMKLLEAGAFGNLLAKLEAMDEEPLQQAYLKKLQDLVKNNQRWDGIWRLSEK